MNPTSEKYSQLAGQHKGGWTEVAIWKFVIVTGIILSLDCSQANVVQLDGTSRVELALPFLSVALPGVVRKHTTHCIPWGISM